MLSERIYKFRRKSGLSQEQLAEKIGVSRQAISKWESGTSTPELEKLLALSECFHITLDELVKEETVNQSTNEMPQKIGGTKVPKDIELKVGISLCLVGAICLILSGIMMVVSPNATEQLNAAAAKITYDSFHEKALIAGCLSSTGLYIEPYGDYTFTEIMSVYRQQVKALSPYCDMFVIETVPALWNMRAAVLACKKENKPIIATMKVDEDGETAIGTNVLCTLLVLQAMGISAFGLNCTSADLCPDIISEIAPYAKIPLIVKPSAVYEQDGERLSISPEEFAFAVKKSVLSGAEIAGGCCGTGKEHIAALREMFASLDASEINPVEKQDTSLALATENQMFFLDPETTEFSPAVECGPYMEDDIAQMCGESYDVLTVSINSPDDAIDFGRNMHMATLPVAFLSDDEISLKMALMLYQGRAIIDRKSLIETEKLEAMAEKYGAVLY